MGKDTNTLTSPIFVALDVDSGAQAVRIAEQVRPFVRGFKLGPRLLLREGPGLVRQLAAWGDVFVDQKYFDIPSTMMAAVRATFDAGASFCTVHAASGPVALKSLAQLEKELRAQRFFQILAVTVLTSFDLQNSPPHWREEPLENHVERLCRLAVECGLSGIVCSVNELARLRPQHPDVFFVTPGIRQRQDEVGDQKRVATPESALSAGASALVIGRPIVAAADPARVACEILKSCQSVSR